MASLDPYDFDKKLRFLNFISTQRNRATKLECDVVVAIDFGTSSSGFAFSFNHKDGSEEIFMNKAWGREQGYSTFKTPTCLLLNQQREFKKFGYEAAEKYAELEDAEDRSFYYFDHFKMMLHGSEGTLNRDTTLKARNGKSLRALDIFAYSLKYLKNMALKRISEQSGVEHQTEEVLWVITVPAIWKQSAKQFMREAAYQAGLLTPNNSDQLIIALEPEAAAVFCRQSKLREFVEERNLDETVSTAFVPAQTQYLVVDNGGGTMDVTAHEVDDNDDVKEIYHATGGDFGGTKVDKEFQNLLEKVFGVDLMDEFRLSHPSDWLELMNDFEMKKRGDRVMRGEDTRVRLPANFINLMRHENIGSSDNEIIKRHYNAEQLRISREYLFMGPEIVKRLFEPTINSIIKHLETLLKKKELKDVKLMFLVGGFSESPLLQAGIKAKFKDKYKILIPNDAEIAVVKGAVMFGRRPHVVVERCLSETYGTDCCADFINGIHKYEKLRIIDGKRKCTDIFSVLARENDKVKMGQCKTSIFCPSSANQTEVGFDFFTSSNPDVYYTTDPGVRKLPGRISVESPNTSKGTKREIKLEVYFNTEIKVIGIDIETGNEATTFIDFLWH